MSSLESFKALKKEYDKKIKAEGENALKTAFKELFEKYPLLDAVTWVQYTPHWNDGETCYFSVHDFDMHLGKDAPEDWKKAIGQDDDEPQVRYGESTSLSDKEKREFPELAKLAKEVDSLNREVPEDLLQYVFGDHCQITVTREGMEVSEYEHE